MSKKAGNKDSMDDFSGLSLTGSQVGTPSSSARKPGSSRGQARPGSASKTRARTPQGSSRVGEGASVKSRNQSSGPGLPLSSRSDVSSIPDTSQTKQPSSRDDFLTLFSQGRGAKAKQKPKPAWASGGSSMNSARSVTSGMSDGDHQSKTTTSKVSKFSHSVFEPMSARSNSTADDNEEYNLNLNISNYSSKATHKSPATGAANIKSRNRTSSTDHTPDRMSNGLNRSHSDSHSGHGLDDDPDTFAGGDMGRTFAVHRDNNQLNSHQEVMSQKATKLNSIANNMTSQAFSGGTKTPLHSMQNSYQNIKPKTPVNEVRQSPFQQQVGRNIAEDYIKKCNMAATIIQRWHRRRNQRQMAGKAAMKRMLETKRQEKEEELSAEKDREMFREEDKKKSREEKARLARQQAIEELQKKRESMRQDNQKKQEDGLVYLQSSGKVSKTPAHKSNIRRKTGSKSHSRRDRRMSDTDSDSDGRPEPRMASDRSSNRRVEELFQSRNLKSSSGRDDSFSDKENREKPCSPLLNNEAHLYNLSREPPQGAAASGGEDDQPTSPSQAATKTTLDDLMQTLKKLEEEDKFTGRKDKNEKPRNWLDDLDKSGSNHEDDLGAAGAEYLSSRKLKKLNPSKDNLKKSGQLTDEKLTSIMSYLDEVDMAERLSEIDQELQKANQTLDRPVPLVPSGEEIVDLEHASATAAEVSNKLYTQKVELEEKKRSVQMLQKALNQQRELTVRHTRETERDMKKMLDVQKQESEETIKRHLGFIDQLIDDKKGLAEKCENLVKELKTVDKKYQDRFRLQQDNHDHETKKLKDITAAAEKLRREKWIDEKTKKIKEMTVKGLEPEIQRLIAKHKGEVKKLKSIHEADLLASDERAGGRYINMTEELRDQLAKEKELACARERDLARQTYEKQLQQEEEAYQQQRRRLYSEVQEEKERVSQQASRQRSELDKLQRQLEDTHHHSVSAMKDEYEKAREEQERRHGAELKQMKDQLAVEKSAWEENYRKRQDTWLLQKERELKDGVRRDRDKDIELVIQRLEEDNQTARDECERVAENRIKRIRDKYEGEIIELERTEKLTTERYNVAKAELIEVQGEKERQHVFLRQKDREIQELKKLLDKLNQERDVVSDVIRQEFADKLVATEEENRRLKNQMSELKARHKVDQERAKAEMLLVEKSKQEEMDEVHKRVKSAILKKEEVVSELKQQYEAAVKRADHLEGLLEQQRKQLLSISKKS